LPDRSCDTANAWWTLACGESLVTFPPISLDVEWNEKLPLLPHDVGRVRTRREANPLLLFGLNP